MRNPSAFFFVVKTKKQVIAAFMPVYDAISASADIL